MADDYQQGVTTDEEFDDELDSEFEEDMDESPEEDSPSSETDDDESEENPDELDEEEDDDSTGEPDTNFYRKLKAENKQLKEQVNALISNPKVQQLLNSNAPAAQEAKEEFIDELTKDPQAWMADVIDPQTNVVDAAKFALKFKALMEADIDRRAEAKAREVTNRSTLETRIAEDAKRVLEAHPELDQNNKDGYDSEMNDIVMGYWQTHGGPQGKLAISKAVDIIYQKMGKVKDQGKEEGKKEAKTLVRKKVVGGISKGRSTAEKADSEEGLSPSEIINLRLSKRFGK